MIIMPRPPWLPTIFLGREVISMKNACSRNLKALFSMLLVQEMPAVNVGVDSLSIKHQYVK